MNLSSLGDALNLAMGVEKPQSESSIGSKQNIGIIERNRAEIASLRQRLHADTTELVSDAGSMTVAKWFGLCIQEGPATAVEMDILRNLKHQFQHFHIGNFNEWRTVFALDDLKGASDIKGFAHLPNTPQIKDLVDRDPNLSCEERSREIIDFNIQDRSLSCDDMKIDLALILGSKLRQILPIQSKTKKINNETAILLAASDFHQLEKLYSGCSGLQGQTGTPSKSRTGRCHDQIYILNLISNIHTIQHTRAGTPKSSIQQWCLNDASKHSVTLKKPIEETNPLELLAILLSQGKLHVRCLRA